MYIDAFYDRKNSKILVSERGEDRVRKLKQYDAKYVFYKKDRNGDYKSLYGDKLRRYEFLDHRNFIKEKNNIVGEPLFESDTSPLARCLSEEYLNAKLPTLNICFFDIEVGFDDKRGYASVDDPFNPITSIALYLSHLDKTVCIAIPPPYMTYEQANKEIEGIEDTYICKTENDMLKTFYSLIEDVDIFLGWNSETYDIPYIVNRTIATIGKEWTKGFCLWDQFPIKKMIKKFKKEYTTYYLVGKVHMDYMQLFKKNKPGEFHSWKLDHVAEIEVGEKKVEYEGTLNDLYNKDFRLFIIYNRQDVLLLKKMDDKNRFVEFANTLAHSNTVLIPQVLGSVAIIEQGITNEAHMKGYILPSKNKEFVEEIIIDDEDDEEDMGVAGAFVVSPKKGLHEYIAAVDINSLYPSAIRTFNMSPETLIGQIRPIYTQAFLSDQLSTKKSKDAAEAWGKLFSCIEYEEIMDKTDTKLYLDLTNGETHYLEAKEIYELIFDSGLKWNITANGTIFNTAEEKEGLIPYVLAKWYSERKSLQAMEQKIEDLIYGVKIDLL